MAQLNGHFYNLVADNTNSGVALDQLVAIIITQYAEIKVVLTTLKTTSSLTSYAAAAGTDSTSSIPPDEAKCCISQLKAAIYNNRHRGAL